MKRKDGSINYKDDKGALLWRISFIQQWHIRRVIFEFWISLPRSGILKHIDLKAQVFGLQISFNFIMTLCQIHFSTIKSSLISYQKPIKSPKHKFPWTYQILSPLHPYKSPIYMTLSQFWINKRKVGLFKWRHLTVPLFVAVCADTIFLLKHSSGSFNSLHCRNYGKRFFHSA